MADISLSMVKELRERTHAGMSACKEALGEAAGDLDKAVEILMKKGTIKAADRAGKVATEGEVRAWISPDKKRGVVVEVNCQTDFVSRGDDFKAFVGKIVELASTLKKGDDLGTAKLGDKTVEEARTEVVAKTGENTVVRRWDSVASEGQGGFVQSYVHMGGKIGVLLAADAPNADATKNADFTTFIDNCAMQIAAMGPIVVDKAQVAAADIEKQKEIYKAQLKEEGKPEQAWPKIIEGKVAKWFTEITLLGQDNVWAPGEGSIDKLRQELGKKLGGEVKLLSFVRFELGAGIEKKTDDLAAEVAKLTGG
jgi:elongation factor Ts